MSCVQLLIITTNEEHWFHQGIFICVGSKGNRELVGLCEEC